jgi:hypothetical protein
MPLVKVPVRPSSVLRSSFSNRCFIARHGRPLRRKTGGRTTLTVIRSGFHAGLPETHDRTISAQVGLDPNSYSDTKGRGPTVVPLSYQDDFSLREKSSFHR